MKTRLLLLVALALVSGGLLTPRSVMAGAGNASGCPSDDPAARQMVSHFLTAPHLAERREAYGVGAIRPADLTPLSNPADTEACRRLTAVYAASPFGQPPYRAAFYKAGGIYFLTFVQRRSSQHAFRTAYIPVAIFDENFQPLGAAAL